jgi:peptide/nickel transport system substrate-binding protein
MRRIAAFLFVMMVCTLFVYAGGQGEQIEEAQPEAASAEETEMGDDDEGGAILDAGIPESWYGAPKTASELGIVTFNESPMLKARVDSGDLPPLEDRLPDDPPVIEPYGDVGTYGGTAVVWGTSLDYGGDVRYLATNESAGRPTPDGGKKVPHLLAGWEYSNNFQNLRLYIRDGMKWSDGTPLTAADYVYWFEHHANNADLEPSPPSEWSFPLLSVTAEDDYTVLMEFGRPNPNFARFNFQNQMGANSALRPAEFMKQYHPDFIGMDKATQMAEDAGFNSWYEYYGMIGSESMVHPEFEEQVPVLRPYVAVSRSETTLVLERNPYFPFVDTEGNQLPYIDRIEVKLANSAEIAETKAVTGEATISARYTNFNSMPLYKNNEAKEDYRTFVYKKPDIADFGIQFNLTSQKEALRPIFQDVRFRRALSMAFDRQVINEKLFFGTSTPLQVSVLPTSELYKEHYGTAYITYDPDAAKSLLDEMGLVDADGDGYRDLPNGDTFTPTFMYCPVGTFEPTSMLEIVKDHWSQVGININLKMVSRELHDQLVAANDFDMTGFKIPTADWRLGDQRNSSFWLAPVNNTSVVSPWPGWESWIMTDGEEGMEPPAEIKELVEICRTMITTLDRQVYNENLSKLLDAQAENLWTIGTVGLSGHPLLVSESLKNVPSSGFWGWGLRYTRPMYPTQFYISE